MKSVIHISRKISGERKAVLAEVNQHEANAFNAGFNYGIAKTLRHSQRMAAFWVAQQAKRDKERRDARKAKYFH